MLLEQIQLDPLNLPFWYVYWIFSWLYKLLHQSTLENGGDDIKDDNIFVLKH